MTFVERGHVGGNVRARRIMGAQIQERGEERVGRRDLVLCSPRTGPQVSCSDATGWLSRRSRRRRCWDGRSLHPVLRARARRSPDGQTEPSHRTHKGSHCHRARFEVTHFGPLILAADADKALATDFMAKVPSTGGSPEVVNTPSERTPHRVLRGDHQPASADRHRSCGQGGAIRSSSEALALGCSPVDEHRSPARVETSDLLIRMLTRDA